MLSVFQKACSVLLLPRGRVLRSPQLRGQVASGAGGLGWGTEV